VVGLFGSRGRKIENGSEEENLVETAGEERSVNIPARC